MPNNFIKNIIKNANDLIKYNNTVTTGEITKDNGDGTYDVKIANAGSAIPDVETLSYDAIFSEGEIVTIGFENGCKESPKILGHSKKIKQEPKQVEVDYSGGCAGVQEEIETIYGETTDGEIRNSGAVYATVRNNDGSGGDIEVVTGGEGGDLITIGQNYDDIMLEYSVKRGYLYFDTSSIPVGAVITSVVLSIYADELPDTDFNLVVQDGQPFYPGSTLIASDYSYLKYGNNGGQINTSGLSTSAYTNITLNSNGIAWINKGGITKLCLRSSKDIAGITPLDAEAIWIYSADKGGDYRPKLTITYEI